MSPISFRLLILTLACFLIKTACVRSAGARLIIENEGKPGEAAVTFTFAKHFQNHLVLQREPARANIYGFSPSIGQTVNAQLVTPTRTYTYSTTVQKSSNASVGIWTVELDPQNADTPANISVTSKGITLTLTDVIFGDVWICSGQSNMQFSVNQMEDAAAEKADVNYPTIRLFTVRDKLSTVPLDDLIEVQQGWTRPSSGVVGDFSAICWVYGKNIHKTLGHAIGLVHSSWGGTPAEAWSSPVALAKCGNLHDRKGDKYDNYNEEYIIHESTTEVRLQDQNSNSVLWNAMIHPLLKTSIKGVIWYQGSADASGVKMQHYNCTFPTMISDWRLNFHQASNSQTNPSFPFGFVQLYPNANAPTQSVGYPDIRWHQTADYGYVPNPKMPNTFMAVAMDLPDFNSPYGSIHPRDKKDVGDRLALGGLAIAYGRQEVFQGPYPSKAEVTASGFKITYGSSANLEIRNISGFELLCLSRWVAANITSHDQVSVTLHNPCRAGESIKGVRYAWRESPCSFKACAVYGKVNSLPAPPFILAVASDAKGHSYIDFDAPVYN
ncbi:unnamed protein product [Candidula unifasciata]|uniref:Sialate O-acetylesterase domain-containing protein n=1 Tax=Candidula unifasciata TaxID=100452 RepID=A0A8S3ZDZ8_9EUPU|nr:unnamed protein product [Candidula unifasciata]